MPPPFTTSMPGGVADPVLFRLYLFPDDVVAVTAVAAPVTNPPPAAPTRKLEFPSPTSDCKNICDPCCTNRGIPVVSQKPRITERPTMP